MCTDIDWTCIITRIIEKNRKWCLFYFVIDLTMEKGKKIKCVLFFII